MSDKKCECKCNSTSNELLGVIGGIVVYELAIVIILLVLIFFDLDAPCEEPPSNTTEPEGTSPKE